MYIYTHMYTIYRITTISFSSQLSQPAIAVVELMFLQL
jgi:hypothetical protein